MNAVMDALSAHTAMSKQALESEQLRDDMKDVLLGAGKLWEGLASYWWKPNENRGPRKARSPTPSMLIPAPCSARSPRWKRWLRQAHRTQGQGRRQPDQSVRSSWLGEGRCDVR
jgi:hypothetical protein